MNTNNSIPVSTLAENGKSLDFAEYLLVKTRFDAAETEFNESKTDLDTKKISSDQITSLNKHKLKYEDIGTLGQKPLPKSAGWTQNFEKAIFVGFKNYEPDATSGEENDDVFRSPQPEEMMTAIQA